MELQIYSFFFIGLAPALQFKQDVHFMGVNGDLSTSNFLYGNLIFLGILILYSLLYKYFNKGKDSDKEMIVKSLNFYSNTISNKTILFYSILATITLFVYFDFNIEAIFHRKILLLKTEDYSKSLMAIFNVVRGIPLILFIFYKLYGTKNLYLEVVLICLLVICNFPTGISRYRVAVTYLPLFIIYVKPFFKKHYFTVFFTFCLLIVFPYLHHFRYNSKLIINPLNFDMFLDLHFDSYQNSLNVIMNKIVTFGDQLLGVLFFWIPKVIWENKPIGSSYVLAKKLEYDGFSNVAIGYFAEGYINFGYFGIVLFVIILAKINSYCDYRFWFRKNNSGYFIIIYLFLIPFEFFILRGSLRSSIANLCGYLFFTIILYIITKSKPLNKNLYYFQN